MNSFVHYYHPEVLSAAYRSVQMNAGKLHEVVTPSRIALHLALIDGKGLCGRACGAMRGLAGIKGIPEEFTISSG